MAHETSIRLPGRLMGVVRTDPAPAAPVGPPALTTLTSSVVESSQPDPKTSAIDCEHLQNVLNRLNEAAAAMQSQYQQLAHAVEPLAVELALAVAARFLQAKAAAGELPLADIIRQAIERLEARQPVQVLLNPDDLAVLERQDLNLPDVRLLADPTLKRGSCKVQSQDRAVRFDPESRLAALRQQLLDAVAGVSERFSAAPRHAV